MIVEETNAEAETGVKAEVQARDAEEGLIWSLQTSDPERTFIRVIDLVAEDINQALHCRQGEGELRAWFFLRLERPRADIEHDLCMDRSEATRDEAGVVDLVPCT